MPSNIDFLLEKLLVDEDYQTKGGNTEPSIIYGMFGNVSFEPWTGFRNIIENAEAVVERLQVSQLHETELSLHAARKRIRQLNELHLNTLKIEEERKALLETREALGSAAVSGELREDVRTNETEAATIREDVRTGAGMPNMEKSNTVPKHDAGGESAQGPSKRVRLQPHYVRKPVTTSSSISDVHVHVVSALRDLLVVMYPGQNLNFEQRALSGENLILDASPEMLCQHMIKVMKIMRKKMPLQKGSTGDRQTEMNTLRPRSRQQGVGAEDLIEPLQEGSGCNREGSDLRNAGNETPEAAESEPMKFPRRSPRIQKMAPNLQNKNPSYDQSRGDGNTLIPTKPVVPLSQTPDQSLFRFTLKDPGVIPVCCFEFKGPTLNLSGLNSSGADVESSTTDDYSGQPTSHQNTRNYSSSEDILDGGGPGGQENEDDLYMPGRSARRIAAHYNSLFRDIGNMRKRAGGKGSESENKKLILLPIAQVICQAILSKTGCVFLTNHQMSFALRVEEDQQAGSFGAKVFVTGAFPSDKLPGQFAAMLGFTKYCMDRVLVSDEGDLLNPLRRLLMSISYASYDANYEMEPLDQDWCPGDEPKDTNEERASSSGTGQAGNSSTQAGRSDSVETHSSNAGFLPSEECEHGKSVNAGTLKEISINSEICAATGIKKGMAAAKMGRNDLKSFRSDMDERLKTMFATTKGLMAVGASGIVIRGVWDGVEVAIKMWNGQSREGFLTLRREIKVYRRLQRKCPSVLGSAVPRFLFGWDRPQEYSVYRKELILLTELVGEGIIQRDGSIWTENEEGYEMITNVDWRLICNSALSGLETLHKNGFIHGDIALRNIRVMRNPDLKCEWRVWWIDLGRTIELNKNVMGQGYFELERRRCLEIFGNFQV